MGLSGTLSCLGLRHRCCLAASCAYGTVSLIIFLAPGQTTDTSLSERQQSDNKIKRKITASLQIGPRRTEYGSSHRRAFANAKNHARRGLAMALIENLVFLHNLRD